MITPDKEKPRIPHADLERLIGSLETRVVRLTECVVSRGWRLELSAPDAPGIHYNLRGEGRLVFDGHEPVYVKPHTLVIAPADVDFAIEVDGESGSDKLHVQNNRGRVLPAGQVRRHVAGSGDLGIVLICGYFRATYGVSTDFFLGLKSPIIEQFDQADRLEGTLRNALAELLSQEIGSGSMALTFLKQVMIMLLRRSIESNGLWRERFLMLSDPAVAHAFADMLERPAARHTIQSLAKIAGLSRSAFIDRFTRIFSKPPIAMLRDVRMRHAARELLARQTSLDQIAFNAGYRSRQAFVRAFCQAFGCGPSAFIAAHLSDAGADL